MAVAQQTDGKAAWLDLAALFHFIEIDGKITEGNIANILEKLEISVDARDLKVKANWHMFKQFHVYNLNQPLFFIKELWQPELFLEVLGTHMGIHFFDGDLCPKEYMFGIWKQEGKPSKPIIITTYVKGPALKKNQFEPYLYELGRQYALHQVLSLYDVDWRHFIVQQGILVRIDFGKSFLELTKPYQGFWDMHFNVLKNSPAFRDGVDFEFSRIKNNLASVKNHLAFLMQKLEALGNYRNFFLDFEMDKFLVNLKNYWKNYLPFPIL
nr:hypothetical protein [Candidatus Sigynarchaeota archaeon]